MQFNIATTGNFDHEWKLPVVEEGMVCLMKEMFYLTTHSTHFMYGYMASDFFFFFIEMTTDE